MISQTSRQARQTGSHQSASRSAIAADFSFKTDRAAGTRLASRILKMSIRDDADASANGPLTYVSRARFDGGSHDLRGYRSSTAPPSG
jgi:hypothetical protein